MYRRAHLQPSRYLGAKVLDAGLEGHLEGLEIARQLLELTRAGNHQGAHHAQSLGVKKYSGRVKFDNSSSTSPAPAITREHIMLRA
jgi:hypothetical protein